MTGKRDINMREFDRKMRQKGFWVDRYNGSHQIYKNSDGKIVPVPIHLNFMMAKRLIKENKLED